MSGLVLATLSDNQSAWVITLAAGVVVLLVVVLLLEVLRRTVAKLSDDLWGTWVNGKEVVKNTATTYLLKNTRNSGDKLVEELGHHG
jgi:hypothetical protein